jgi:hypothetical protein
MGSAADQHALSIVGLSGNIKRPSKTRVLIQTVLDRIETAYGIQGSLFDLLDAPELGAAWDRANINGRLADLRSPLWKARTSWWSAHRSTKARTRACSSICSTSSDMTAFPESP